jgi:hypothetical protein
MIVATLAMGGAVASAQVSTVNAGDLILGVQQSGAANVLEIDLGSVANLTSSFNADISSALTAAGLSNLSLDSWSIAAAVGGANAGASTTLGSSSYLPHAFWVTQASGYGSVSSLSFNSATVINTNVVSLGTNLGGLASVGTTGLLANAAVVSASDATSYATYEGGNNYGLGSALSTASIETTGAGSADLYGYNSLTPGVKVSKTVTTMQSDLLPTLLGTFTLSSTGELSFTATAIPEPSTYAMILGVAALGFVMLRRRQQVTA